MQKITIVRWLVLAGFALAPCAWAGSCAAVTPAAAVQTWIQAQTRAQSAAQTAVEALPALQRDRSSGSYRVERVMTDSILHKQWALVASCDHPAQPLIAVELPRIIHLRSSTTRVTMIDSDSAKISIPLPAYVPVTVHFAATANASLMQNRPAASPMLVHAGDHVVLWNREPELHLAIAAVSLEYGREGQIIHLRRDNPNTLPTVTMTGVVRGPGSVELMP